MNVLARRTGPFADRWSLPLSALDPPPDTFVAGSDLLDLLPAADLIRSLIETAVQTSPFAAGYGLATWSSARWERRTSDPDQLVPGPPPHDWVAFLPVGGGDVGLLVADDLDETPRVVFSLLPPPHAVLNESRPSLLTIVLNASTGLARQFAFAAKGPCEVDPTDVDRCLRRWCNGECRRGHTPSVFGENVPACFCDR